MASEWTGGGGSLYDSCKQVTEEGDSERLLQCVIQGMENRQDLIVSHANSYLLVLR